MEWATIAEAEVLEEFANPGEQAAMQAAAGAVDNLPAILARVVNEARGIIGAAGHDLGAAGTIPDSLRADVIAVTRWRLLVSYPALKSLQTEERKAAHDRGIEHFDEIGDLKRSVEAATEGARSKAGTSGTGTRMKMRTETT